MPRPTSCAVFALACSLLLPRTVRAEEPPPTFPHEQPGEHVLVLDFAGAGLWVTEREPLPAFAPLGFGVGYAYRMGVARVGSRLGVLMNPFDTHTSATLLGDLVSVERVYGLPGRWRPYWRVALGFVLDLVGASALGLGEAGFFNSASGAAGGLSLGHGWGLDAFVSETAFLRLEADARLHGGAGRVGLLFGGHFGAGFVF